MKPYDNEPTVLEITGTRGSGKTTALISMLKYNNCPGNKHIVISKSV
jgi:Tfp pilus assembly pilus retraction ATPase PilT